jgi:MFS transporter, SHS family, sialic acid transporter
MPVEVPGCGIAGVVRTQAPWLVLTAAFLGWMFDGLEQGVMPLVGRPALQDLLGVTDDRSVGLWMGVLAALYLLGAAGGGILFGWLGDRLGRVRAMVLSILAYSVFTGCSYFVRTPLELGGLRFLASLGMGGEWSLGVALVMECWPEKLRPLLSGAIGAAANFGLGLMGALGAIIPVTRDSWRWVMLAGAAPALLALFVARKVPESETWRKAVGEGASRPFHEIFSLSMRRTTILAICFASVALIGTWGSVQWLPAWADQLTRGHAQNAKGLTQLAIAVGAVFGCFIGPLAGGRIGRRPAYFSLCLASLLLCGYLFRCVDHYGTQFLFISFLIGGATGAFYGWLPLYLPELFSTRVRATGQGLCFNSGRVLAAVGALEMGHLLQYYEGSYARAGANVTLIYAAGLVLIWFAPETKGKTLPA